MFIYSNYNEAMINAPFCIALGSFDGFHVGHIKLIETVTSKAKELNCKSMLYTFSEHPKKILTPKCPPELITDNKMRIQLAEKYSLNIYFENFLNVMNMDSDDFVEKILNKTFKIRCAVAGYNYRFGCGKDGDAKMLEMLGEKYGFGVHIIEPVMIKGNVVSSSLIRDMIKSGNIESVKAYLGRYFSINGTVIHGKKYGGKIGIRTANIAVNSDIVIPKLGVYLTNTIIDKKTYKSVTNIGFNPTFNGSKISIETHIINFDGYLYDCEIEVVFLKWQRKEKCFNSLDELKQQINYDINCRLLLNIWVALYTIWKLW